MRLLKWIGVAGAIARVDEYRASRGGGNFRRKTFPVRDRAQTLVQKDKLRLVFDSTAGLRNTLDFEPMTLDSHFKSMDSVACFTRYFLRFDMPHPGFFRSLFVLLPEFDTASNSQNIVSYILRRFRALPPLWE